MNFNLVWFPPTVAFPALRNSVSRSAAHIILLAFILARQLNIKCTQIPYKSSVTCKILV